jgi:hypothetical protein
MHGPVMLQPGHLWLLDSWLIERWLLALLHATLLWLLEPLGIALLPQRTPDCLLDAALVMPACNASPCVKKRVALQALQLGPSP